MRGLTPAVLVSLPLVVLGCTGPEPLGLGANAARPRFDAGSGAPGVVSGQGEFLAGAGLVDFNIEARRLADGTALGAFSWSLPTSFDTGVHERITCLAIDGNLAWINTVVVSSTNPSFSPVGQVHTWIFQDGPDGVQGEFFFVDCTTEPPVTAFIPDALFRLVTRGDLTISGGT